MCHGARRRCHQGLDARLSPVRIDDVTFHGLMTLEPHGPDTYVGVAANYPWGDRLYGGQVFAQALRAAYHTVVDGRSPHSMHAYFIRPGTPKEPVRFEVQRLRDGGSFSTRQVVARQSNGVILTLSLSFQDRSRPAPDVQRAEMPADVPPIGDESLVNYGWSTLLNRLARDDGKGAGYWLRLKEKIGDDPLMQACALAFISDGAPMRAARVLHPHAYGDIRDRERFRTASLDHTLWIHRPTSADDWHWFATRASSLSGSTSVVIGEVFTQEGIHVATIAQEALLVARDQPSV